MSKRPMENELDVNDLLNLPSIQTLLDEDKSEPKVHAAAQPMPHEEIQGKSEVVSDDEKTMPKGVDVFSGEKPNVNAKKMQANPLTVSACKMSIWERFIQNCSIYENGNVSKLMSNFRIEQDVLLALESLDFKKMNITKLINCILRTFIEEHSKELKKMRRKRGRSILDSD